MVSKKERKTYRKKWKKGPFRGCKEKTFIKIENRKRMSFSRFNRLGTSELYCNFSGKDKLQNKGMIDLKSKLTIATEQSKLL